MFACTVEKFNVLYILYNPVRYSFLLYSLGKNFSLSSPKSRKVYFFVGLLLLHTVLFGYIIVNPIVSDLTTSHATELLVLYITALCVARYAYCTNTFRSFLIASMISLSGLLIVCFFIYDGVGQSILYLKKLPFLLFESERTGMSFGFSYRSYTGNYLCLAIILIFAVLITNKTNKYRNEFIKRICSAFIIAVFAIMLIATTSRGEILSALMFFLVYSFISTCQKIELGRWRRFLQFLLILLIFTISIIAIIGTFKEGSLSNRSQNFTINMEVFKEKNAWLTGLGYIEAHGFYDQAYGYLTWPCDVYYLYVFFSTGILGSAILGINYIVFGIFVFRRKNGNQKENNLMKAIFSMLLFDNLYHAVFGSYYYVSFFVYIIMMIYFLYNEPQYTKYVVETPMIGR